MNKLVLVVEGDGEVEAAPVLARRILYEYFEYYEIQQIQAINAGSNSSITTQNGLERFLEIARRIKDCKGVIVLLDSEEKYRDYPVTLVAKLVERTKSLNLPFPVAVVCARCEYESWFLGSLHTLAGTSNLKKDTIFEGNPEHKCNAKEWLTRQMPDVIIYKETIHQSAMTVKIDIPHLIENVRSFRRMVHAVEKQENTVTPVLEHP